MIILGTNSIKDTGFDVANSLRFNDGSTESLSRSTASGTDTVWTWSGWLKRSHLGTSQTFFGTGNGSSSANSLQIRFDDSNRLDYRNFVSGAYNGRLQTNALFRDVSAWYHFVFVWDTTQGTAGNRMKVYINGVQETSFVDERDATQNSSAHTSGSTTFLGTDGYGGNTFFDGYLAEVVFIDGTALDATSFGEFDEDSGIWKPINVSGLTFGTNGFYLDFEDSGALGDDVSGNGNDFTVNNLTAIDQSTDTCTNNFATLNPLDVFDNDGRTLSNGNLDFTTSSGNNGNISGTLAVSGSGKWYFETKILAQSGSTGSSAKFGIVGIRDLNKSTPDSAGNAYYIYSDGRKEDGANTTNSAHPGYVLNDIVQVAFDLDGGNVYFGLNGNWGNNSGSFNQTFGNATAFFTSINTGGFWSAYLNKNVTADNVLTLSANFGSPSFSISSGNTDGNGYGNFEYAVPSGYYSLNTKNLSEYG